MRLKTWPVAALGLCGLLVLIVVSMLAASRRAQEIYAQLDQLNTYHQNVDAKLRRLRSDVNLSGIFVRDYLLDVERERSAEYREQLAEFRKNNMATAFELRELIGQDGDRIAGLQTQLDEYWAAFDPLFDWTPSEKVFRSAGFLRTEVVPRRDAALTIALEIEELNNANLAAQREEVAGILGMDAGRIPAERSLAYDQIIEGIVSGRIRGLWVVGTNPAHSWINRSHLDDVLDRLDFLVVQDMYASTETARKADLVLPAAGWGEKEGTFINSERRVGLVKRVAAAPGQALADFHIFRLLAGAWGCGDLFREWDTPEAVFRILQRLSAGRPCDITGIDGYGMLDDLGGIQWPFPGGAEVPPEPERRLFEDGRFHHPDGRARFVFGASRPPAEATSRRYPLVLLTGRGSAAQWHTQTRTAKSPLLRALGPGEPYVEVAPADGARIGVASGDRVVVRSARGTVKVRALVTPTIAEGQVFLSMHWPETNLLTQPSFDPSSRQPSYKHCAVELSRPESWE